MLNFMLVSDSFPVFFAKLSANAISSEFKHGLLSKEI